jgi:hypothetical protein
MHVPLELFSSLCSQKWRTSPFWRRIWRIFWWRRTWSRSRRLKKDSFLSHFIHINVVILYGCLMDRQSANMSHRWLSATILWNSVWLARLEHWLRPLFVRPTNGVLSFEVFRCRPNSFIGFLIFKSHVFSLVSIYTVLWPAVSFDNWLALTAKPVFIFTHFLILIILWRPQAKLEH